MYSKVLYVAMAVRIDRRCASGVHMKVTSTAGKDKKVLGKEKADMSCKHRNAVSQHAIPSGLSRFLQL